LIEYGAQRRLLWAFLSSEIRLARTQPADPAPTMTWENCRRIVGLVEKFLRQNQGTTFEIF
jgi:hypothetical protein